MPAAQTARCALAHEARKAMAFKGRVKVHNQGHPVTGRIVAMTRDHKTGTAGADGGSNLILWFDSGQQLPLERATRVEAVL